MVALPCSLLCQATLPFSFDFTLAADHCLSTHMLIAGVYATSSVRVDCWRQRMGVSLLLLIVRRFCSPAVVALLLSPEAATRTFF